MSKAEVILCIFTLLAVAFVCTGCATFKSLSPDDNRRIEDEFQRNNPNPVPPPVLIPRR